MGRVPRDEPRWHWRHEPFRTTYIVLCAFFIMIRLPWWAVVAACGRRPRPDWSVKRCLQVRVIRHINALVRRCDIRMARDLSKDVKAASLKYSRHIWVPAIAADKIKGFVLQSMAVNDGAARSYFWSSAF
jgi:hypothetical protein